MEAQEIWVEFLLQTHSVTVSKSINHPVPQFPNGNVTLPLSI